MGSYSVTAGSLIFLINYFYTIIILPAKEEQRIFERDSLIRCCVVLEF